MRAAVGDVAMLQAQHPPGKRVMRQWYKTASMTNHRRRLATSLNSQPHFLTKKLFISMLINLSGTFESYTAVMLGPGKD